jgi:hypothetical protein
MKLLRLKTSIAKMQGIATVDGQDCRGSDPDVQVDGPMAPGQTAVETPESQMAQST